MRTGPLTSYSPLLTGLTLHPSFLGPRLLYIQPQASSPPCSVICYSKVAAPSLFPRTNCLVPSWGVTGTAIGDSQTPTPHPYGNHRTKLQGI